MRRSRGSLGAVVSAALRDSPSLSRAPRFAAVRVRSRARARDTLLRSFSANSKSARGTGVPLGGTEADDGRRTDTRARSDCDPRRPEARRSPA